ncbi:hypothetical protein GCM10017655_13970 [Pseudomonas turukhanskensis]|uniref:Uncharacterized protein n=1 Tax=Pseudomonas turukhanskensis TaxID=1806536 RepID=A0A9W6K2H6_9PSED|nr:hypothetical protein GCM10017655_13970 [Pseudomonas turukhanskensis]
MGTWPVAGTHISRSKQKGRSVPCDAAGLAMVFEDRKMGELTETEKKLAVLVIREMDKNRRSIKDLERGADAVLKVFRKVTSPPKRSLLKRLLLPFGRI